MAIITLAICINFILFQRNLSLDCFVFQPRNLVGFILALSVVQFLFNEKFGIKVLASSVLKYNKMIKGSVTLVIWPCFNSFKNTYGWIARIQLEISLYRSVWRNHEIFLNSYWIKCFSENPALVKVNLCLDFSVVTSTSIIQKDFFLFDWLDQSLDCSVISFQHLNP